jgi:NitT/TauT family transport system permease protein
MTTQAESGYFSVRKRLRKGKGAAGKRWSRDTFLSVVPPLVLLGLMLLLWGWAIDAFDVQPTVFPRPKDAFDALVHGLHSGTLVTHTLITLQEVVYGFALGALGGFALGAAIAEWEMVRKTLFPFVVAIQMVPKVAIAPFFIIWLGYGIESKVAITASMTFFPVLVNTVAGLRSVDGETLEMLQAFRFTKWQAFHRVKLRFALPYIFVGLDVAVVLSVIGAIVAEFVGSTKGLGYLILQATYQLQTPQMFAVLLILAVLGVVLNGVLRLVARKVLFWHDSERTAG